MSRPSGERYREHKLPTPLPSAAQGGIELFAKQPDPRDAAIQPATILADTTDMHGQPVTVGFTWPLDPRAYLKLISMWIQMVRRAMDGDEWATNLVRQLGHKLIDKDGKLVWEPPPIPERPENGSEKVEKAGPAGDKPCCGLTSENG